MDIFVGNLAFVATEADLKTLFAGFGTVSAVTIVMEKGGKRSRGFGFVEMPDTDEAEAAIAALNAQEFMGRELNVSVQQPKTLKERQTERKKKQLTKDKIKAKANALKKKESKQELIRQGLAKKGGYKGGRRTHSFLRRLAAEPETK